MMPIPKRLLTSTARVKTPKAGGYGGEYEDERIIEHVRFEPTSSVRATDYQLQNPTKGTLIIDAVNSEGAFNIPAGSLVSVDGAVSAACVHAVSEMTAGMRVHHWEVELA